MTLYDFDIVFASVQREAHRVNVENGWWEDPRKLIESRFFGGQSTVVLACLWLITSEVAEAMEAVRKHDPATWADDEKKGTLVRKIAGCVVNCMNLAGELDLPLAEAIRAEIQANRARGHKHGGKAA